MIRKLLTRQPMLPLSHSRPKTWTLPFTKYERHSSSNALLAKNQKSIDTNSQPLIFHQPKAIFTHLARKPETAA
jgi:hypothetical protein